MSLDRRKFLHLSAGATLVTASSARGHQAPASKPRPAQELNAKPKPKTIAWHDPLDWGLEGRGFDDTLNGYDRLPERARQIVRKPVWDLSRMSSGISFRFKSDTPEIHIQYELTRTELAMPHMPATGVSGVDLYARDDQGEWRWVAVLKPTQTKIESKLVDNLAPAKSGMREFMVYLPLYNGVVKLQIGVASAAKFDPVPPREKPILFYGTSIMQGACASRSGMSISAILGRRLDRPTLNLGFSGNGRMETEVGQFICELDPSVFVIDCLPNMNAQMVTERCQPLVRQIRAAHQSPILLVEDRVNPGTWIRRGGDAHHAANRAALKTAYDQLLSEGVRNLHYLTHDHLLGTDGESTTDGSHPSDLGMVCYADAYEAGLRAILAG